MSSASSIGIEGVAASMILIVIAVAVSMRNHLGLERSIAWASLRALAQMIAIGGALGLVLADGAPQVWSWLWVAAMVIIGSATIASRAKDQKQLHSSP